VAPLGSRSAGRVDAAGPSAELTAMSHPPHARFERVDVSSGYLFRHRMTDDCTSQLSAQSRASPVVRRRRLPKVDRSSASDSMTLLYSAVKSALASTITRSDRQSGSKIFWDYRPRACYRQPGRRVCARPWARSAPVANAGRCVRSVLSSAGNRRGSAVDTACAK
jgi:hypothetical protein